MTKLKRCVLVFLALATVFLGTVAASPTRASSVTPGCAPTIGNKVPVEFVHGFLGAPSAWTSMEASLRSVQNLYLDTPFDYSQNHTDWVDNPAIGPKLAQRIACLATSSRRAGGPGKVILVVHSMGGLAVRWAANDSSNPGEVANDLGLVITIATPNLGSGWANTGTTVLQSLCEAASSTLGNARPAPGSFCASWSAVYGMQDDSHRINTLAWLPRGIPVYAIAGDVSLDIPLFLATPSLNTNSDLAVSEHSAIQGVGSSAPSGDTVVPCAVNIHVLDPVAPILHGLQNGITGPTCWHSALPHNASVEQTTVSVIKQYLAATAGIPASYVGTWLSPVAGTEFIINADGSARLLWGGGASSGVTFHAISNGIDGAITSTSQPHLAFKPGSRITITPAPYGGLSVDTHGASDFTVMYKVAALPASTLVPYVGASWYVHGASLVVKPDSTGVMKWNAGPCGNSLCTGTATIMFDTTLGNGIIGVFTTTDYTQPGGQPAPPDFAATDGDPHPGYLFKLEVAGSKLLYTTWLGHPAEILNSGNRNWCWVGITYPGQICGA